MTFAVRYLAESRTVETRYIGDLTPDELRKAVDESLRLATEHETFRFLGDCSELSGGHALFDLFNLIDPILTEVVRAKFKEAVLLPRLAAAREHVLFWETACRNRGLNVQSFPDREHAVTWLGNA